MILPPFDLSKCSPICHACVKKYNKKYGKKTDKWKIDCTGIPKEPIPQDVLEKIPKELRAKAIATRDPVEWARMELGWEPRFYQTEMLKCTAKHKVSRCGRQIGKSEAIAIFSIFKAVTNKDYHVVILTPMSSHTELLFKRISELIKKSDALLNSVVRRIRSPYNVIEFSNGSVIEGFTSGEKSGGEGDVIRGRSVNLLIFDEADMLSPSTFDSSLATTINFPDSTTWVSSTPKGKKERFYKCCVESPDFQEFHFPSQVNPNWGERQEEYYRGLLTEIGYKQEILAEFSTQVEGVFQRRFVENAMEDYDYQNEVPRPGWIYCVGVDWNDVEIGTRILVVGYNPADNKFKVVAKDKVSKEGWNQVEAMRKIRNINRLWKPSWIYVDNRPSPAHVEMLRLLGAEAAADPNRGPGHPDAKLKDIVKGYEFGGKVNSYDIFTKERIKRPAKVFLIENAVRRFEAGQVIFSKHDAELESQLLGYIIDRYTANGTPVYKASPEAGDHDLDALSLALIGFTLEMTILGRPRWSGNIAVIDEPLQVLDAPKDKDDEDFRKMLREAKKKKTLRQKRKEMLPETTRGNLAGDNPALPVANSRLIQRKLWSWPGWERDAPRPSRQKKKNGLLHRRDMPKRSNI